MDSRKAPAVPGAPLVALVIGGVLGIAAADPETDRLARQKLKPPEVGS